MADKQKAYGPRQCEAAIREALAGLVQPYQKSLKERIPQIKTARHSSLPTDAKLLSMSFDPAFILRALEKFVIEMAPKGGRIPSLVMDKNIPAPGPVQVQNHSGLNAEQAQAVEEMAETPLHFLWGPPGTGKTTTLGVAIARWLRQKKRVLVVSTSNAAVDVALRALLKNLRPDEKKAVLRLGTSIDPEVREVTLGGKMAARNSSLAREIGKTQDRLREIRELLQKRNMTHERMHALFVEAQKLEKRVDEFNDQTVHASVELTSGVLVTACTLAKMVLDASQAEEQGKGRLVGELIQNALDEAGVTKIDVNLAMLPGVGMADLTVEDDSAEGFHDLTHAYTLFAPSAKRANPEQRGQFNFGEKLVLAVCEQASIITTKGTVIFDPEQGRIEKPDNRERGSVFQGRMRMTQEEYAHVCDYLRSLLLPEGIAVSFNGQQLLPRTPIHIFTASLETQIADDKGVMRPTSRKAEVALYEALPGEVAHLYEMGLPIVETSDKWHVSVGQKIPLNKDRNNCKPAYLKAVRTFVLNEMCSRLTEDDANADWVRQASSSPDCSEAAITKVLDLRFGEKRAAFDPNDPEANKKFVAEGGRLVYGPNLSPQEWKKAKEAGAIQSAGKICPTPKPYSQDSDAEKGKIIPKEQWTDGMNAIAGYARFLGRQLMNLEVTVTFVNTTSNFLACYAPGGDLHFNLFRLGHAWFEQGITEAVIALLIHEYGHQESGDHLSEEYHEALCRLGARLGKLALEKPDELRRFQWR